MGIVLPPLYMWSLLYLEIVLEIDTNDKACYSISLTVLITMLMCQALSAPFDMHHCYLHRSLALTHLLLPSIIPLRPYRAQVPGFASTWHLRRRFALIFAISIVVWL